MADKKISQLTELTTFTGNEDIPIVSNGQNYRAKKSAFGGGAPGATTIAGVTGLQAALDDKASVASVTAKADTTSVTTALAGKADVSVVATKADATHNHAIADTTGLQAALDDKASVTALDTKADVTALTTGLATKANVTHNHAIADVTGLQTALDNKTDLAAVDARIQAVVGAAPEALNTLAEIAQQLEDDQSAVSALTTTVAGKANSVHNHDIADTTGLQAALDTKADLIPVMGALADKADNIHSHATADITGLQAALDNKATVAALDAKADATALTTGLATKADAVHTHGIADVTGLQTALDSKVDDSEFATFSSATSTTLAAKADVVALANKSDLGHTHVITEITGLETALDDALGNKANLTHNHVYTDISNMSGLEDHMRALMGTPVLEDDNVITTTTAVNFDVNVLRTKGYSLAGCDLVCTIQEDSGPYTQTLTAEPFVLGTAVYSFEFTGLVNTSTYTVTVNVIDGNQTDVAPVISITIPVTLQPV